LNETRNKTTEIKKQDDKGNKSETLENEMKYGGKRGAEYRTGMIRRRRNEYVKKELHSVIISTILPGGVRSTVMPGPHLRILPQRNSVTHQEVQVWTRRNGTEQSEYSNIVHTCAVAVTL
jgi:hypothetical protein